MKTGEIAARFRSVASGEPDVERGLAGGECQPAAGFGQFEVEATVGGCLLEAGDGDGGEYHGKEPFSHNRLFKFG